MPLKKCTANGKSGWKWGDAGKCYTGPGAKRKAIAQAVAIGEGEIEKSDADVVSMQGARLARLQRRA